MVSELYKTTYGRDSNIAWRCIEVVWIRHGGGAQPGKYHIFVMGLRGFLGSISEQCVVDDFGDLVAVGWSS